MSLSRREFLRAAAAASVAATAVGQMALAAAAPTPVDTVIGDMSGRPWLVISNMSFTSTWKEIQAEIDAAMERGEYAGVRIERCIFGVKV